PRCDWAGGCGGGKHVCHYTRWRNRMTATEGCHGADLTRRGFLTAGALGFAGLTLADLLRAEAAAGIRSSHKAVINVHLDGGPPQLDTIDLKPQAPPELRGEFRPIATRLPGLQVCELMPKIAQ